MCFGNPSFCRRGGWGCGDRYSGYCHAKWVCTLFGWVLYGFYLIFVLNAEFWKFNFVVGLHLLRKIYNMYLNIRDVFS